MYALLPTHSTGSLLGGSPVRWQHDHASLLPPGDSGCASTHLSVLDSLAAPTIFIELALLFDEALDAAVLHTAAAALLREDAPALAGRLSTDVNDNFVVTTAGSPGAAILLGEADADATILAQQSKLPDSGRGAGLQLVRAPRLTEALFGHLPGSLTPAYVDAPAAPLTHIALVRLSGGGCVLGLRTPHLLCDWSSTRTILRRLTVRYAQALGNSSGPERPPPPLPAAAPLLDALAAWQNSVLPADFQPLRLKLQDADDDRMYAGLAEIATRSQDCDKSEKQQEQEQEQQQGQQEHSQPAPSCVLVHALPEVIARLKAKALTAQPCDAYVSSHDALIAYAARAFARLPGRSQLPHDVAVAVDMRRRLLGPALLPGAALPTGSHESLPDAIGNFFGTAILEGALPADAPLSSLAAGLRAAIMRAAETWLPDLAWAAEQLKRRRVSSSSSHVSINEASRHPAQQQPQLRVTWRRLHAMGPRHLLEHQVALGALPSITATQWPIDYGADATFNGVSPVLVVPGFSSPQPYPLLLMQQAPPAWGGGLLLYVWVDAAEAPALCSALLNDAQE